MVADVAAAQPLDNGSRACVDAMNRSAAKVSSAQTRENSRCFKRAAMGKPPGASTEACLVTDLRGKLERARGTTLTAEARHCDVAPVFAYSSAAVVNEAAVRETIGLLHDVFGQNLDTVVVDRDADHYAARCQSSAAKSSAKLLAT